MKNYHFYFFDSWKKNFLFEAIFCILSAFVCFVFGWMEIMVLSIFFLIFLVPYRAFTQYLSEAKIDKSESDG